jgi:hypothetical protein
MWVTVPSCQSSPTRPFLLQTFDQLLIPGGLLMRHFTTIQGFWWNDTPFLVPSILSHNSQGAIVFPCVFSLHFSLALAHVVIN